jgi:hypothetical protein
VALTFTGAPEGAVAGTSDQPEVTGQDADPGEEPRKALRMFVANDASEAWFHLEEEELAPWGWDETGATITATSSPPDALVEIRPRRRRISLLCRGPAVVQVDQPAVADSPDSRPIRVYAVIVTDRGAVSEANMRRLATLSSYREAEEFKSQVIEEYRSIVGHVPAHLHGKLAKAWLELHNQMLDKAYESGVVRGRDSRRTVAKRLEKIAAVIIQGEG